MFIIALKGLDSQIYRLCSIKQEQNSGKYKIYSYCSNPKKLIFFMPYTAILRNILSYTLCLFVILFERQTKKMSYHCAVLYTLVVKVDVFFKTSNKIYYGFKTKYDQYVRI